MHVWTEKGVFGRLAREEIALRLRLDLAWVGVEDPLVAFEEAKARTAENFDPGAGLEGAVCDGRLHERVAERQAGRVDGASGRDGEVVQVDCAEEEEAGGFEPGGDFVGQAGDV